MPRRASAPRPDLPDIFIGSQLVADGVLTASQLRGPLTERVLQGVYRPSWVPASHVLRCRAAALVLPPGGLVTGASMATVLGVNLRGHDDDVAVVVAEDRPADRRRGLDVRRSVVPPPRGRLVGGVPLTSSERMGFDLATRSPFLRAVACLDAVAAAGHLDLHAFRAWLASRHEPGVRAARRAADAADGSAESLPESMVRVTLREAGIDVVPQYVVRVEGRVAARVDLAIPRLKLAIEYDGAWHVLREQLEQDRQRLNRLALGGWRVVHVTASMLRSPDDVVLAVRAAMREQSTAPGLR